MRASDKISCQKKQTGFTLFILVILFALVTITYIVKTTSVTELKTESQLRTISALKKAKQALLNYAVNYPEISGSVRGPGYFPCPDNDNDGVTAPSECNSLTGINNVGRLPYVTLGSGDLRDSANERLWYAVTKAFDYHNSPTVLGNTINSATVGTLTVRDKTGAVINDGTTANGIVAVIIAPGLPLTREDNVIQSRGIEPGDDTSDTAHRTNQAINYLDIDVGVEDNATFEYSTLDGFINGDGVIVNDQIETITYSEIMEAIHKRVKKELVDELAVTLNAYYAACGRYPDAAVFNPNNATFNSVLNLQTGQVPKDTALPTPWGGVCVSGTAPIWPLSTTSWLTAESWYKFVYYEFCAAGVNCISLNGANDTEALLVFAGNETAGQTRVVTGGWPSVPSSNLNDYFENENNTVNSIYSNTEPEDFVYILRP